MRGRRFAVYESDPLKVTGHRIPAAAGRTIEPSAPIELFVGRLHRSAMSRLLAAAALSYVLRSKCAELPERCSPHLQPSFTAKKGCFC